MGIPEILPPARRMSQRVGRLPMTPQRLSLVVLCLAGTASCRSYNERTVDALHAFEEGRFGVADKRFESALGSRSFLAGAERGMVALAAGKWDDAIDAFGGAVDAVKDIEREALISPENVGELLTSWVVNETMRDYQGEGYERAMLHACLGLAYLAKGKVEDVLVEVRLANELLETEAKLYDTDYRAGGLAHVLSAIAYELQGQLDDAYIDYARMAEKDLGGDLVGASLVRLSRTLGRSDQHDQWARKFGDAPEPPDDTARVILIGGVGLGPFKEEKRLDLPTRDGVLSWAVPSFQSRPQPVGGLTLVASNLDVAVHAAVVEDVGQVANKNLDDRIAWLAAKSTVRTFLKRELRQQMREEHGAAGALIGDLFNFITERADLRAWTTLPDTWQVARMFVSPGEVELAVSAAGAQPVALGRYRLEAGETMFVLARSLGHTLHAHAVGGHPVVDAVEPVVDAAER